MGNAPEVSVWARFIQYAPRIKKLSLHSGPILPFPRAFDVYQPTPLMLPNLSVLDWRTTFKFFFSPNLLHVASLKEFTLTLDPFDYAFDRDSRSVLSSVAHNVTGLTLQPSMKRRYDSPVLSNVVCKMNNLRRFRNLCGRKVLSREAIIHLATVPMLEHLDLEIEGGEVEEDPEIEGNDLSFLLELPEEPQIFANLKSIAFRDSGLYRGAALVSAIRSKFLAVIELDFRYDPPTAPRLHTIFRALSRHLQLREIVIYDIEEQELGVELGSTDFRLTMDTLRPLLSLRMLEVIDIDVYQSFDMADADLKIFAESWPNLTKLYLYTNNLIDSWPAKCTLAGLIPLMQNCPNLLEIELRLDTERGIPDADESGNATAQFDNQIHTITVGNSPLCSSKIPAVAAFFSAAFPKLEVLTAWGRDECNWVDVAARIHARPRKKHSECGRGLLRKDSIHVGQV
jgi:hypothetical protein